MRRNYWNMTQFRAFLIILCIVTILWCNFHIQVVFVTCGNWCNLHLSANRKYRQYRSRWSLFQRILLLPLLDPQVAGSFKVYFFIHFLHIIISVFLILRADLYFSEGTALIYSKLVIAFCAVVLSEIALALEIPHRIKK